MNLLKSSSWSDVYARRAFPVLVQWAEEASHLGKRPLFSYKQLAATLGVHHRSVHWALGAIGDALESVTNLATSRWGKPVPPIELLVCAQESNIPGEGGLSFLSRYRSIPRSEIERMSNSTKRELVLRVHDEIYAFSHWREVLGLFGLRPGAARLPPLPATLDKIRKHVIGGAGESEEHKKLKQHIFTNPSVVGISGELSYRKCEEITLSGDRLDIFFKSATHWFCVEVKPAGAPESDLIRGLMQCVKYSAVLEAQQLYERMQTASTAPAESIDVRLAIGGTLPPHLEDLRRALGVELIQEVAVPRSLAARA